MTTEVLIIIDFLYLVNVPFIANSIHYRAYNKYCLWLVNQIN